ncbi:hypothetical protein SARC_08362 [Sphaeroforma arctica JP610]|uniref:Uncharacterized protein n=1 Tax=Sphaeroforma arctica JP610 TaxID=667725 RepID=A0A0L0FTG2_9EUKA|nr:hypothetical protein SARC_08362 [Sphaeroforma arctica JP610]KNC79238.1 hypothetical protein SARC_08362 [Sphaeroforma arctica JP610]|eukprot:XP_014153140.1 hypothetical protein SARC_08362 [Sphaeroforma arctica JP610]
MSGRVSSAKSGNKKTGQTHQNKLTFQHDSKSRKSNRIFKMNNSGVCPRCHEQIEWRKKFKKYKPLKTEKRCTGCGEKKITRAYHVLCKDCAHSKGVCAKCTQSGEVINKATEAEELAAEIALQQRLALLSERERRSYFRAEERGEDMSNYFKDGRSKQESDGEEEPEDDEPAKNQVLDGKNQGSDGVTQGSAGEHACKKDLQMDDVQQAIVEVEVEGTKEG